MKIWKNLFGNNDKINAIEIAVAPGLLLPSAVIVESGSNTNGEYVRFGDGTQICWHNSVHSNIDVDISIGALWKSSNVSWAFPKQFISPPRIFFSTSASARAYFMMRNNTTNSMSSYFFVGSESANYGIAEVNVFSIGRWK